MQIAASKTLIKKAWYYIGKFGEKIPINMDSLKEGGDAIFSAGKISNITKADLGTFAIKLSRDFDKEMSADLEFIEKIYANKEGIARYSTRVKNPFGIFSKLEKGFKTGKVTDYKSARAWSTDGKGLRVELNALKNMNRFSMNRRINKLSIEGRKLSAQEKNLLKKYIYSEQSMTKEEIEKAFPIFEKFITPLVEQHSKPVYDEIMLSIVKQRMVNEGLTIKEIREKDLLSEELIKVLTTREVIPRNYEILNNYRGEYGIPVFSNRQVQMMRKASGGKLIVHSRPDMLEYSRHPHANLTNAELGIKESGYQGAQFKVANCTEEQYRGLFASEGAEVEHSSYDAVMKKFTCRMGDAHVEAMNELSETDRILYNEYKAKYYNAWARRDLGLPYKDPEMPAGFRKELSMEYIEKVHKSNEEYKKLRAAIKPHFESVA